MLFSKQGFVSKQTVHFISEPFYMEEQAEVIGVK